MPHTLTRPGSTMSAFTALLVSVGLTGLYIPVSSAEQIYKWVDENGVVTFGDKSQRPTAAPTERVEIKAHAKPNETPTDKAATTGTKDDGKLAEDTQAAKDKPAQKEKPAADEKPKIPTAEKRKRCQQARQNLAVIQSRGQVRESDARGNTVYLTDQQKQSRIKSLNQNIREYCR